MPELPYQFVIYGDSRTLSSTGSGQDATTITGYSGWVEAFTNQAFELVPHGNYAINGATNSEWQTLFTNYAQSEAPIAILLIGLNSQAYGYGSFTLDQRKAQIGKMLDELGAAGKQVYLVTEAPRTSSYLEHFALHQWLNDPNGAQLNRPWITPVDVWDKLADPNNNYLPNPDYFYDGVHLTAAGNVILGKAIADAMLADHPDAHDRIGLPTSNADLYSPSNPNGILIANPMLEGTGGKLGNGITGDLAAGWNINASTGATGVTAQVSKDLTDTGLAEQVVHLSGTSSGSPATITLWVSVPVSSLQQGDMVRGAAVVEVDPGLTGVISVSPVLFVVNNDGSSSMVRGMIGGVPGFNLPGSDGLKLPFATPELEVAQVPKTAQFQIVISLAAGASVDGTIRISQTSVRDYSYLGGPPINHAPDAVDDAGLATAAGTALTIPLASLLGNDHDQDGNVLSIPALSSAVNGTVARVGSNIVFTPAAGFTGAASFVYTLSDGHGLVDTAKVSITVGGTPPANRAPDAVNDGAFAVAYNTALSLTAAQLLANDTDPDGNALTVTGVGNATGGSVALSSGQIVFTPSSGYSGAASFTYSISDGKGGTDTASVALNVASGSQLPQYVGTTGNDSPPVPKVATEMLGLAGSDVLRGSVYADVLVGGSGDDHLSGGTGGDQYRFFGTDIEGTSDYDRLYDLNFAEGDTIALTGFGTAKFAVDGGVSVLPDGSVIIQSWAGVVNLVQQGAISARQLGTTTALELTLTNAAGQKETLFVKDGWTVYSQAAAADPNDAPNAVNDGTFTVQNNTALTLTTAQLLGNDADADADALTITGLSGVSGGTVTLSGGQIVFTPTSGYIGTASFNYSIADGHGGTDTATVSLNVAAPPPLPQYLGTSGNDSPPVPKVATEMLGLAGTDTLRGSTLNDVLVGGSGDDHLSGGTGADRLKFFGNDIEGTSDYDRLYDLNFAEGDTLLFGAYGAGKFSADLGLTVLSDGSAVVDSWAGLVNMVQQGAAAAKQLGTTTAMELSLTNASGQKQTLFIKDGWQPYTQALAADANAAPVAANDGTFAVKYNTAFSLNTGQLLANDTDPDADALTVSGVAGAAGGVVDLSSGQIVFTPAAGYSGAAAFDYIVSDGRGGTDTGAVTLNVEPPAPPPQLVGTAGDDSLGIPKVGTEMLGLAGNDLLRGGTFNDTLVGGSGDDHLSGGLGSDKFQFSGADIEGTGDYDRVYDLNFGESDTLVFSNFGAGKFAADTGLAVLPDGSLVVQSWGGMVNAVQQGGMTARQLGTTTALEIALLNESGQTQQIFIKDAWALYNQALIDDAATTTALHTTGDFLV